MKITKVLKNGMFKTFKMSEEAARDFTAIRKGPAVLKFRKLTGTTTYIMHQDDISPKDAIMNCKPMEGAPKDVQRTIEEVYKEAKLLNV